MSASNITKVGCILLITRDGKLLLGKRKNCFGAGTWGLPGGHLEFNERMVDAAVREAKEELGLTVDPNNLELVIIGDRPLDDAAVEAGHERHIQIGFRYSGVDFEPKLMEPERCEEWRFFELDDLPEVFVGHRAALELFVQKRLYA